MVIIYSPHLCLYHKCRRSYGHFNDLMTSRRPYWIFFFWKLIGVLVPLSPLDGHRVELYVYFTNTEEVMAILMISRSRGGHIGIMFGKLLGALVPLAPLAMSLAIESKLMFYHKYRRSYGHFNDFMKSRWPYWI